MPWISGTKLVVSRGMTGATGNIYVGLHEFSEMCFVLHFLQKGDLFLDVGANVGTYTVLASGVCGAQTWAFEPDPVTAAALQTNIDVNQLGNLVTIHRTAVGSTSGDVRFTVGLDTTNRVAGAHDGSVRVVPQKRLDDLVREHDPMMIKMDIEGYEAEALAGACTLMANPCLKAIQLETVSPPSQRLLESNGFENVYYDPYQRSFSNQPPDGNPPSNALFIRDAELVRSRVVSAPKVQVVGNLI